MEIVTALSIIIKYFRGYLYRRNNLPNSIRYIQYKLINTNITCSKITNDGRNNSINDENTIINILKKDINLNNRLKFVPKGGRGAMRLPPLPPRPRFRV